MGKIEDTYRIDDAIVKLEESGGGLLIAAPSSKEA